MKIKAMDETQYYRSLIQDEALRLRHRMLATLFFFQSFIQIPPYLHICYDNNYLSFLCRSLNISINRRSFIFYHFPPISGSITILPLLFGPLFFLPFLDLALAVLIFFLLGYYHVFLQGGEIRVWGEAKRGFHHFSLNTKSLSSIRRGILED